MRPERSTWVASTITNAAPELASMPRCTRCQSLAQPSSAEYWHIGDTTRRLASSRPASFRGEKRTLLMRGLLWMEQGRGGRSALLLNRVEVGDDGTDLVGVKSKFRHIRVAGHDALAQGFFQRFDGIAGSERAEGRRIGARAGAGSPNRVAPGAILGQQVLAELEIAGGGGRFNRRAPDPEECQPDSRDQ